MQIKHLTRIRVSWWIGVLFLGLAGACSTEQVPLTMPLPISTQTTDSLPTQTPLVINPLLTITPTPTLSLPTATIKPEPTVALPSTPLPTRLPNREVIAFPKSISPTVFIINNTLWLIENEQYIQKIPLGNRDNVLLDTMVQSAGGTQFAWLVVSAEEQAAARAERRNILQTYPVTLDITTGELIRYYEISVARQSGLSWSADSTYLYLKLFDSNPTQQTDLSRLEIATGRIERITTVGGAYDLVMGDFALTEENDLLFSFVEAGNVERNGGHVSIFAFDVNGGEHEALVEVLDNLDWQRKDSWENAQVQFALNPLGGYLAFTVGGWLDINMRQLEKQGLYLFEQSTGTLEQIISEGGLERLIWSPDGQRLAVAGGLAEGSILLIYALNQTEIMALTNEQLVQVKQQLANLEDDLLTFLSILPVAWLSDQELLLQISFAFIENPEEIQYEIMTLNVVSGELKMPSWSR